MARIQFQNAVKRYFRTLPVAGHLQYLPCKSRGAVSKLVVDGRVPAVLWKRQQRMEDKAGGINYHSSDKTLR